MRTTSMERATTVANEQNLVPLNQRTKSEQREIQSKGGVASGESRRKTKTFREAMLAILDSDITDEEQRAALELLGLAPTYRNRISLANVIKAADGDGVATALVRDTVGEKPRDGLEIGNLDGRPLASLELSKLSDEQLMALASRENQ